MQCCDVFITDFEMTKVFVWTHSHTCRGNKTRINRQFRKAVLATDPSSSADNSNTTSSSRLFSDVTRVDYEEALVELQLVTGCGVRMCASGVQLAHYVVSITKALAEVPYQ